jgi:hypothetical protein
MIPAQNPKQVVFFRSTVSINNGQTQQGAATKSQANKHRANTSTASHHDALVYIYKQKVWFDLSYPSPKLNQFSLGEG